MEANNIRVLTIAEKEFYDTAFKAGREEERAKIKIIYNKAGDLKVLEDLLKEYLEE